MIAVIHFRKSGTRATATLGDDRRWTCPAIPSIAAALNVSYTPDDHGPADGELGYAEARDAAEWLKGTLTFPIRTPAPENAVY